VGEARSHLVQLDRTTRLELAPEVDQELRDLLPPLELGFDAGQRAAAIPERALLAGTALGVALGNELDRAELPMLDAGFHTMTVARGYDRPIGAAADLAAGSYGPGARARSELANRVAGPNGPGLHDPCVHATKAERPSRG